MTETAHILTPRVVVVGDDQLAQCVPAPAGQSVLRVDDYLHAIGELSRGGVSAVVGRLGPLRHDMQPTIQALRTIDRRVPLLLVTAAEGEPDAQRAVRLGFDDYFIEPLRGDEIVAALRHPLGPNPAPSLECSDPRGDDELIDALIDPRLAPADILAANITRKLGGPVEITPTEDTRPGITLRYAGRAIGRLVSETVSTDRLNTITAATSSRLALIQQHERFRHEAYHDNLTGAWNRRYFEQVFDDILHRAQLNRFRVSLMIFDIDDFKIYNDTYGHAAGDEILREATRLMRTVVRKHDVVARIGGDEFAVLFWDAEAPRKQHSQHPTTIKLAAKRFQKAICEHRFPKLGNLAPGTLTISGGLAGYPWDGRTREELMHIADEMLLQSKRQGKNALTFGPGIHRSEAEDRASDNPQ